MGCNSSKKKENQHVRQWDQEEGRGNGDTNASGRSANARNGDGTSFSRSTAQQSSTPRGIGSITNRESKENGFVCLKSCVDFFFFFFFKTNKCLKTNLGLVVFQRQNIAFEDEFILSTSTQNRLKEHELMNAIITRSAGKFVDVNQVRKLNRISDVFFTSSVSYDINIWNLNFNHMISSRCICSMMTTHLKFPENSAFKCAKAKFDPVTRCHRPNCRTKQ